MREPRRTFTATHGIVPACPRPVGVMDPGERSPEWHAHPPGTRLRRGAQEAFAGVDLRDVVEATAPAPTVEGVTQEGFLPAATDTLADLPTAAVVDRFSPELPWKRADRERHPAGDPFRALVDGTRARGMLGRQPRYGWRGTR